MASIQDQATQFSVQPNGPDIGLLVRAETERVEALCTTLAWNGEWSRAGNVELRPVVSAAASGFVPGFEEALQPLDLNLHTFAREPVAELGTAQAQAAFMVQDRRHQIEDGVQPPPLPTSAH